MKGLAMSEQVDNTKLFHKIVRDFNKKTGFKFKLPEDTNYSGKYAHPVHDDGVILITSQIDDNVEKPTYASDDWVKEPYALRLKVDGVEFYGDSFKSYDKLKEVIATKEFNVRLNALKEIDKTLEKLQSLRQDLNGNLVENTMNDLRRERIYDEMTTAARLVYEFGETTNETK